MVQRRSIGGLLVIVMCAWAAGCGGGDGGGTTSTTPPGSTIPAPSNLSYPVSSSIDRFGTPITTLTPTVTGKVTSWAVTPTLPRGIGFNQASGVIAGTPTAAAPTTTYTIVASNSSGSASTQLTFEVLDAVPPSNLHYPAPTGVYTQGQKIAPLVPTWSGGPIMTWSIRPSPPWMIFLDTKTGIIGGTPNSASPMTTYTIAASNSGGYTTTTVSFAVKTDEPVPQFAYGSCPPLVAATTFEYTMGVAALTLTPFGPGDDPCQSANFVTAWSISSPPALPAGLAFNSTNGAISGTPTATSANASYTITGSDLGGQSSVQLSIGVSSNVLLNLGHTTALQSIQFDAAHVLSQETSGHWALWNYATMAQIASGGSAPVSAPMGSDSSPAVSTYLAGPTVVIVTSTGFEVRSSATGVVLSEIAVPLGVWWWQLATDGSYLCAGGVDHIDHPNGSLTCWAPTGQQLFTESGNYLEADVFAAPSGLLVADGAAGTNVIETVSSATWTSSVGTPFQGEFQFWFLDGAAYLTRYNSNTVNVYSPTTTLQETATLPSYSGLNGLGHWLWTYQGSALTLYAVGSGATPTATYTLSHLIAAGSYLTALSGTGPGALTVVDLSGATPDVSSYNVPNSETTYAFNSTAFSSPSHYMVGTAGGLLIDESTPSSPRTFDYGALTNMAGSTARAVFTTISGDTFSYNSASNSFESTVDLSASLQYVLSADGSVLATIEPGVAGAETVDIYSLPSKTLINSFSYPSGSPAPQNITLTGPGTTLGELLSVTGVQQTLPVTGGAPTIYATNGAEPVQVSPNGTLVALSSTGPSNAVRTSLYNNGVYVTTVVGYAVGWLDNDRLLVDTYLGSLIGANIFSPTGALLGVAQFPAFETMQVVSSDLVYSPVVNQVMSVSGANDGWASGDQCGSPLSYYQGEPHTFTSCFGAYVGLAVVFASGNLVLAQPY